MMFNASEFSKSLKSCDIPYISNLKADLSGDTVALDEIVNVLENAANPNVIPTTAIHKAIIAIILYLIPFIRRILEPYLIILNSLPKIALGPLIIVWVGIGTKATVTMGILICIIITTISLLNGFLEVDEEKRKLLKTMGASNMQVLTHLIIPATLPNFISVLKINVGMSWVGVIMGEYLSSKAGLGYLIVYGGQVFKLDLVMTSIVVLCVLAGLMYGFIALLEKHINKKRNL